MLSDRQRAEIAELLSKLPPEELQAVLGIVDRKKSHFRAFLLGVRLSHRNSWFASTMGMIQTYSTYCPICYPPHPEVVYIGGPDGLGHSESCTHFEGRKASLVEGPAPSGWRSVGSGLRDALQAWLFKRWRRPPPEPTNLST